MSNIKGELRENMRRLRDSLPKSYRDLACETVAEEFAANWGCYDSFALYSPIGSEVDTAPLLKTLSGKDILYPKVFGGELVWGKGELIVGYAGIREPVLLVDYRPQAVVAPCLAFDKDNYRLGYGKGYYDRFLAKFPDIFSVAIAFACQEVDTVFPEPHDVRVAAVLTDKKLLSVKNK
ncbi:MAG: 5-formyltetrahydrofolate cyclo-ligase [Deferribacteraceae bacterium]|jgi:5-formyltetrahydrofolate cyclo-ligase|nr:5-formyltetrahydrofolate cyclo-ligase [Deferribacteraceae bacterium]